MPNTNETAIFTAGVFLSSNRTATNVTLKAPASAVTNLFTTPMMPWEYFETITYPSLAALQAAYPNGSYVFTVQALTSNQTMTVTLSSSPAQPNAPQVTDFAAAQGVNPTQPFTLAWNVFAPLAANNFIMIEVMGGAGGLVLFSNTLPGTATSLVIPAGTLQSNTTYSALLDFDNISGSTNASYATVTARASLTSFSLVTGGGGSAAPSLPVANIAWSKTAGFTFEIACTPGQSIIAECSGDLLPGHWWTVCSTNCTSSTVCITDPQAKTNAHLFYRARTSQ